jgi:hypothetical protein
MKIKYKKMIIMVSMCTMGIGLVTFSVSRPSGKSTTPVEKMLDTANASDESSESVEGTQEVMSASVEPTTTPATTEEASTETMEAAIANNPLEKNAYKDINALIKKYLNAKLKGNIDTFKPLVNDTSYINLTDIERKTKYIEAYKNVACYTKKGPEEGSYVVYAYHEVKFTSIDTLAPAMNEFYIKSDKNGDPYIYLGEIDNNTEKYLDAVRNSDDVMDLIYTVNDKLQQAVKNDSALFDFYSKLEESAKDVTMNNN